MKPNYFDFLQYWRNSLADGGRMSPSDGVVESGVKVGREELDKGQVATEDVKELFSTNATTSDDEPKPLPVLVVPLVLARAHEHGVENKRGARFLTPIILSANLTREGKLLRDGDAKPPVLARDLLEPSSRSVTIGTLEDADRFYSENLRELPTWEEAFGFAQSLFESVAGKPLETYSIPGWQRETGGRILALTESPEAKHLLGLYDWLRRNKEVPLLQTFLSAAEQMPALSQHEQLRLADLHRGHYGSEHPLAPSQRVTLLHLLKGYKEPQQVFVVNGPPGTGKTTLIQNVVASLWVNAALQEEQCPLIVATSTSNQAVTNVIRAFDQNEKSSDDPLSGRWLLRITSFGMYMASARAARANSESGSKIRQLYEEMPTRDVSARHFASSYETKEGVASGTEEFLSKCVAAKLEGKHITSLTAAKEVLLSQLRENDQELRRVTEAIADLTYGFTTGSSVSLNCFHNGRKELETRLHNETVALEGTKERLATLHALALAWNDHKSQEPWWISLFLFLGPVKRRRRSHELAFMQEHSADLAILGLEKGQIGEEFDERLQSLEKYLINATTPLKEKCKQLSKTLDWFTKQLNFFQSWCSSYGIAGEESEVLKVLDTKIRHRMFQLATHYWEAMYLLEVEKLLDEKDDYEDSKTPLNLERHYRRLAMLAPCFISTLHMLPKWFRGYSREETYLVGAIDLLIVDEAGQVAPENAAAALAIGKRACIFGDEHQIEPVWSVAEPIDRVNASHYLGVADPVVYDRLSKRGFMAASGSVLKMAQGVSSHATHPQIARGFFLTEHRRCLSRIIAYCNELVYQGLLEPCRAHQTFSHALPPFGWIHVPGHSAKEYGSQVNDVEAETIVTWIKENETLLKESYNLPLKDILAVVTPFTAQARGLTTALRKKGLGGEKLTVGTLHAMQGAERPIVIFSPVYGINHQGGLFFNRSNRMLNVAVSRAKDAFIVIGNMDLFRKETGPAGILGTYLFSDMSYELVPPPAIPPPYVSDVNKYKTIATLAGHREILRHVFETAKERIIVAAPFLTRKACDADGIPQLVQKATGRGVSVMIVADVALNRNEVALKECIGILENAGARVLLARQSGIHCKVLCRDRDVIASGSFNWLAAVREENQFRRFEMSFVLEGPQAEAEIARFIEDIGRHVEWPTEESKVAENL